VQVAVLAPEPLGLVDQQQDQREADEDQPQGGQLVGRKPWNRVVQESRALDQDDHRQAAEQHAAMAAAAGQDDQHEGRCRHGDIELRRVDVLVIERVQAAGNAQRGAAQREQAQARAQHVLAHGLGHQRIVAQGAGGPSQRRARHGFEGKEHQRQPGHREQEHADVAGERPWNARDADAAAGEPFLVVHDQLHALGKCQRDDGEIVVFQA